MENFFLFLVHIYRKCSILTALDTLLARHRTLIAPDQSYPGISSSSRSKNAQLHRYARPHITEALWYYLPPQMPLPRSSFSSVSSKNIHLSESFPCNHNIQSCAFNLRFSWRKDNKDIGVIRQSCKNKVEERSFDDNFRERMRGG